MNWIFPETYGFVPRRGGGVAFDAGSANVNNTSATCGQRVSMNSVFNKRHSHTRMDADKTIQTNI